MRNETIRRAYDSVLPDAEAKERMLRNILSDASNVQPEGNVVKMKKRNIKKGAIIILAAALALALSVMALAYATDLFGFRALARPEPEGGYADGFVLSEGEAVISITQPQDVPDEIDAKFDTDIAGKLENSRLAWNEWQESKAGLSAEFDAIMEKFWPKDFAGGVYETDNGDGTVTWEYEESIDDERVIVDTRVFTEQETQEFHDFMQSWNSYDSGYDFNYSVHSDSQKTRLEKIAEKYGLKLRGDFTLLWSSETTGMTGDQFFTNAELVDIVSGACCSGTLFYETPIGFDKVYFWDEGTFGVAWYVELPSSGVAFHCYGYNSMYDTLSSGNEISGIVEDIDSFTERSHTSPDGTELTILSNGNEAYIYVYLENSFFTVNISQRDAVMNDQGEFVRTARITDEDLDWIADNINYSVIGK